MSSDVKLDENTALELLRRLRDFRRRCLSECAKLGVSPAYEAGVRRGFDEAERTISAAWNTAMIDALMDTK